MARIHEIIEDLYGPDVTEEMILEAFRSDHPGFTSHPIAHAHRNGILVRGDFNARSSDCSAAGYFERYLCRHGNVLVAEHLNIFVEERFRKQKLATYHLSKLLRFYEAVGIEYVVLEAAGYGAIVWPQLGFELREPAHRELLREQFRSLIADLGYDVQPPQRTPPLALTPPVEGVDVGLEALDHTYRALGCEPIPMILDLKDGLTRAFLSARGILEEERKEGD